MDPATKEGRGSARSAGGVNLYQALHQAAAHLQRYGGHAAAAGFSVRADNPAWLEELRAALTASVTALTTTAMTTRRRLPDTATTLTLTSVTSELSRDGISPAVLDAADASAEAQLARGSGPAQAPAGAALDRTLQVDAELPLARVTLPLLRELE
ncbi:MAG: hypothetical protein IPI49_33690, partial [Myxococcales bacterium]|nr:hypothetical protein [Myxococcales bacterium]